MFPFFKTCLFCNALLPDVRKGVGEHVFPRSILGFWRIYDVCSNCMSYFGDLVDGLAVQNPEILRAMESLNLRNVSPLYDNLPWKAQDTLDGQTVKIIRRDGDFRIKVTRLNDFLKCPEDKIDSIARPWLWESLNGKLTKEKFETEFALFLDQYNKLKAGESYISPRFGYTILRREATSVQPGESSPADFTQLVAKIVYCFLRYAIRAVDLPLIEEYDALRGHARLGTPMKPFLINWLRPLDADKYNPFHSVTIRSSERNCIVDTTFFGNITWRTVLHTSGEIMVQDPQKRKSEAFCFILDFCDCQNREMLSGFKLKNSENFEWYEVRG